MRCLVLVSICMGLAVSTPSASGGQTCSSMVGVWHNQLGSTLTISSIDPSTGLMSGNYVSPSGAGSTAFPLTGWVNQQPPQAGKSNVPVLSFAVRFGSFGSITSWTGYCDSASGSPQIVGLWHLTRANSDLPWDHIIANEDTFTPGFPLKTKKPG